MKIARKVTLEQCQVEQAKKQKATECLETKNLHFHKKKLIACLKRQTKMISSIDCIIQITVWHTQCKQKMLKMLCKAQNLLMKTEKFKQIKLPIIINKKTAKMVVAKY